MHIPAQQAVGGAPEDRRSGPDEDVAEHVPVPAREAAVAGGAGLWVRQSSVG
jgi:hypothetical protein